MQSSIVLGNTAYKLWLNALRALEALKTTAECEGDILKE